MSAASTDEGKLASEVFKAKYRRIKLVGKGSFGEATLVRCKADGKRYIVKTVDTSAMSAKEKRDLSNEIRILAAVRHPNIVRYHEHFEDGPLMFIAMEYADGGDLSQRLKERKKAEKPEPFDPKLCMFWFLQIAMALKYMHDKRILHRDLKTANIFLTSKNVVKLGDFGISTVLQNTMACARTVCGTPYYFSPEICQSKPYNNKSDVWALGVVFYETLTLNRPFNAKSLKELLKKILVGQYDPLAANIPVELRSLCASLLQISPAQRPSVNRVLELPFVQGSLKTFSEELESQTSRDRADYEERKKAGSGKSYKPTAEAAAAAAAAAKPAEAPKAEAPAEKKLSEKEQMAQLRNMGRANMQAMLKQNTAATQAEMAEQKEQKATAGPSSSASGAKGPADEGDCGVEDEEMMLDQKDAMKGHVAAVVGTNLQADDDFGDAATAGGIQDEVITMSNGAAVPAGQVRALLEKDMGAALINSAMDYVNDLMASPNAPSNAAIQRELNALLGMKFAHHSNAITRLAMWEGKIL